MGNLPNQFPAIEFRHVTIAFENVTALRDVSFTLAQNESLLINVSST